ncbi:MAG: hypothetical protein ABI180_18665 [Microcoleus sp.]
MGRSVDRPEAGRLAPAKAGGFDVFRIRASETTAKQTRFQALSRFQQKCLKLLSSIDLSNGYGRT